MFSEKLSRTKKQFLFVNFDKVVLFIWPDNTFDMLNVFDASCFRTKQDFNIQTQVKTFFAFIKLFSKSLLHYI